MNKCEFCLQNQAASGVRYCSTCLMLAREKLEQEEGIRTSQVLTTSGQFAVAINLVDLVTAMQRKGHIWQQMHK